MEPSRKRKAGREVSYTELRALSYAINHFPEGMPNRWKMIAEYVQRSVQSDDSLTFVVGSSGRRFDHSHTDCQYVAMLLGDELSDPRPDLQPFFMNADSKSFMPVILLPPVNNCCGKKLLIRSRPSNPRVYTQLGTQVAAVYAGECTNSQCHKKYHYSYIEESICSEPYQRFYYPANILNQQEYFQVSSQTVFSVELLRDITLNLEVSCASFESRAVVYNEHFGHQACENLKIFASLFKRCDGRGDPWKLNEQRVEEAWFLWQCVAICDKGTSLDRIEPMLNYTQTSHHLDIEALCEKTWDVIVERSNEWIHHSCSVKGCAEGYVTVDGIEKVRRPMCAAPKEKVKLPPGFPNYIQCCPNSPVHEGKSSKASRYCSDHLNLAVAQTVSPPSKQVHLPPEVVSLEESKVGKLPDNDDDSQIVGCKNKSKVDRFYDRTAGLLAAVRPCGIIVGFQEMFTCESPSQVYIFLWLTFGRCLEDLQRLKVVGYDRTCDLHPFLLGMQRKGGAGAHILLQNTKFLVDKFHCLKHTEKCCMPLDNPECKYHPDLDTFKEVHGTNTECAEQAFNWLGRYKRIAKNMTKNKYKVYIWCMVQSHNRRIVKQRAKAKSQDHLYYPPPSPPPSPPPTLPTHSPHRDHSNFPYTPPWREDHLYYPPPSPPPTPPTHSPHRDHPNFPYTPPRGEDHLYYPPPTLPTREDHLYYQPRTFTRTTPTTKNKRTSKTATTHH